MARVITYQFAYTRGQATLCGPCVIKDRFPYALGPVNHGRHNGACQWCQIVESLNAMALRDANRRGTSMADAARKLWRRQADVLGELEWLTPAELRAWVDMVCEEAQEASV